MVRAGVALALANARYWSTVAPTRARPAAPLGAARRSDPRPDAASAGARKLREERFNAQVAATLATLAPRVDRAHAVEAIVALQVLYDYLDGLTEQPVHMTPCATAASCSTAFTDAVAPIRRTRAGTTTASHPQSNDDGYLEELRRRPSESRLRGCLAPTRSPRSRRAPLSAVARPDPRTTQASRTGTAELREWATTRGRGHWRLSGRSSSPARRPRCLRSMR